jgi:aminoglycoside/choline kinase family phosphotransferase
MTRLATYARDDAMDSFVQAAGWAAATRHPLPGDASTRRYVRLAAGARTAMLMDQPQQAETQTASATATQAERAALGYNALARLAGADCGRFVAAARYLRQLGLSAPDIYAEDTANGFLLLEDLGDDLYADIIAGGTDETALYAAAIDTLAALHAHAAPAMLAPGKPLFAYDTPALLAETDLLTEWFLPMALGRAVDASETAEHRALWRETLASVSEGPQVFVHRDFHAQNLLWLPERAPRARVGLIDFQDAVAGSPAYDLISLLEDARRDVSPALAQTMTEHYIAQRDGAVDRQAFRVSAAILAAQRNAKIVGIFARLAARDKKPRYLAFLPRVWGHMERDLAHPALARLRDWYDRKIPREARFRVPHAEGE